MGFTRVATHKSSEKKAVVVEVGGELAELEHSDLTTYDTPAKLKTEVESQTGQSLSIFFHFNRDGSLAVATGAEPDTWPEDEKE